MRIDVMLTDTGSERTILVEIVVSNSLDPTKLYQLRWIGYEVLVIDCSYLPQNMEYEVLQEWLAAGHEDRELRPSVRQKQTAESELSWSLLGIFAVIFAAMAFIYLLWRTYHSRLQRR